jgi:hypothetical protein
MAEQEAIPFYEDGAVITATCAAAVVGKTFLRISASRPYGPGFSLASTDTSGGNVVVETAEAGKRKFGVAAFSQPVVGGKVTVLRAPGLVVPVVAGLAIVAFAEVSVGAGGKAVPQAGAAGTAASLQTGTVGANNGLTFTAKELGDVGNDIIIKIVKGGPSAAQKVVVVDNTIEFTPKTSAGSVSESTAKQMKEAIEASPAAAGLVAVANTGASTGAGLIANEESEHNLSEGLAAGSTRAVGYALSGCNENEDAQIHIY